MPWAPSQRSPRRSSTLESRRKCPERVSNKTSCSVEWDFPVVWCRVWWAVEAVEAVLAIREAVACWAPLLGQDWAPRRSATGWIAWNTAINISTTVTAVGAITEDAAHPPPPPPPPPPVPPVPIRTENGWWFLSRKISAAQSINQSINCISGCKAVSKQSINRIL